MAKEEGCILEGYQDGHDMIAQSDLTIICLYPSKVLDLLRHITLKREVLSQMLSVLNLISYSRLFL